MSRVLLVLTLFAIGCGMEPAIKGSGKVATDNRPVGTFTEVECAISCAVDVKKGEKTSVELSIDDNLLPLIKTEKWSARNSKSTLTRISALQTGLAL